MLNADTEHTVSVSLDRDLIFSNSCLIYLTKCTLLASMFAFWQQHDRLYVIARSIVLLILIHGLLVTE
jgi:uncharacterized membrane protein